MKTRWASFHGRPPRDWWGGPFFDAHLVPARGHRRHELGARVRAAWRAVHRRLNDDALLRDGALACLAVLVAFLLAWWWDGQLRDRQEVLENTRFVRQVDIDDARDKPFQALNLHGATLAGLELSCPPGSSLGCADFTNSDLSEVNLANTDLTGALMGQADLSGAWLGGSILTGAYLSGADLSDADLIKADLRSADLGSADLRGANLVNADLESANMAYADLRGADLRGARLIGASLFRSRLEAVQGGGRWTGAMLAEARLAGARLHGTDLRGVDLSGADLSGADLSLTSFAGADLEGADLSGADLTKANLEDAELAAAVLSDVTCDQFTQWPPSLSTARRPTCSSE